MNTLFLQLLGQKIKECRRLQHISQEDLAWSCGITKNGLGKIELGRSQVRITTLLSIMKELKINFEELQKIYNFCNEEDTKKN